MRFAEHHGAFSSGLMRLTSPIWSTSSDPFRSRTTDAQHRTRTRLPLATGLGRHPAGRRRSPVGNHRTSRRRRLTAARRRDVRRVRRPCVGRRTPYSRRAGHAHRGADLPDRPVDPPGPAGGGAGGPRLRVAVGHRAHPHPDQPAHAVAGRPGRCPRSTAARSTRTSPSTAAAAVTERLAARHRDHARRPARPDRPGQDGRLARPPVRRTGAARHRRRLERGRDGAPRRRPEAASRRRPRARPGDARAVDARRRPPSTASSSSFSPSWSWPKPVVRPAPADPHGRRRWAGDVPPRRRVLRRLDADPRPPQHRRQARRPAAGRRRRRAGTWRRSSSACSGARPTGP